MSDKFTEYPQYDNDTTTDCDDCEKRIRAEVIDELKNNCIEHIQSKRPLTLEEITNIIFFEAEQLKGVEE